MNIAFLLFAMLAIFFGPQLWASTILKQHQKTRDDFPGTGGEFARHLLDQLKLTNVKLESCDSGDHYDPIEKVVRLNKGNFDARSLTAIVVAAHEVGHALQDHLGYRPLKLRTQLAQIAYHAERAGALLIYAVPIVAAITRTPYSGLLILVLGIATMGISAIVHLVTLPVEFDASFARALPILKTGAYLDKKDMRHARKILLACALTYVAASLAGLLNVWRWVTIFRK